MHRYFAVSIKGEPIYASSQIFPTCGGSATSLAGLEFSQGMLGQRGVPIGIGPTSGPNSHHTIWSDATGALEACIGQGAYESFYGVAWVTLSNSLASLYGILKANPAYDQSFMAAAGKLSIGNMTSANINQAVITSDIQTTSPQITSADVQIRARYIDALTSYQKQVTLGQVVSLGLSPFIFNMMGGFAQFANLVTPDSAISISQCEFTLPPPPPNAGGGDPATGGGRLRRGKTGSTPTPNLPVTCEVLR